jgi:hypothetical protein
VVIVVDVGIVIDIDKGVMMDGVVNREDRQDQSQNENEVLPACGAPGFEVDPGLACTYSSANQ